MIITIVLPEGAEALVKTGQKLDFKTPFMKSRSKEEIRIPLASQLHIQPAKIFNHLTKFVGDKVKKGELMAQNKSLFINRQYFSEYDGLIKDINHVDGTIGMQVTTGDRSDMPSSVKGEISAIDHNQIKVKVTKGQTHDLKSATESVGGEAVYFEPKYAQLLTADDVDGRIIIAYRLQPYDQVKLETLGARGFVTIEELPESTSVPTARLGKIKWEELSGEPMSYCTIDANSNTMYLYN